MIVTAKDLRFNISYLFDILSKKEDVLITYRGKPKAKLIPYDSKEQKNIDSSLFGIWKDKDCDVDSYVRDIRAGRSFAI